MFTQGGGTSLGGYQRAARPQTVMTWVYSHSRKGPKGPVPALNQTETRFEFKVFFQMQEQKYGRSPSPSLSPVLWMVPAFLQIWTWYWFKKLLKIKPIIFIWNKFFTVGEMKSFQFIRYSDHLQFPNPVCWGKLESWLDLNVLSLSWQPGFLFCLCMVCV